MPSPLIFRIWIFHLAFHSIWFIAYLVSLLGVFILIPLVGWYNAFVLGFLGKVVLTSAITAMLLGYVVFSVTGLVSGWLISLIRPRSAWGPAILSLLVSCVMLISLSWLHLKNSDLRFLSEFLPATTGQAGIEDLKLALKAEYIASEPDLPPHVAGKGKIIALSEVTPMLSTLPSDFVLSTGPYVYCNLPPDIWKTLRQQTRRKYPLVWSSQPDSGGQRLVISLDFRTDMFHDELASEEGLAQMLSSMEIEIRSRTGDEDFKLE